MRQSLAVFLSGTFTDLKEERRAVLDVLQRLNLAHGSMETFGARPELPLDACLDQVRASDALVVLVGTRYGSVVPRTGVSYTECEYDEAYGLSRPCLIYMRDGLMIASVGSAEAESGEAERLIAFRRKLRSRHMVYAFTDSRDLAVQVAIDVGRLTRGLALEEPIALPGAESTSPNTEAILLVMDRRVQARLAFERAQTDTSSVIQPQSAWISKAMVHTKRRRQVDLIDESCGEVHDGIIE
jgi:hypothetical protein